MVDNARSAPPPLFPGNIRRIFKARIVSHVQKGGNPRRWDYTCRPVYRAANGSWVAATHESEFIATNDAEDINPVADGPQGNGVDSSGEDYPPGFNLKPIPIASTVTVYEMRAVDGSLQYTFDRVNLDDGTCEATT